VEVVKGVRNDRHERNRVRGTLIIIITVVVYLVSNQWMCPIWTVGCLSEPTTCSVFTPTLSSTLHYTGYYVYN